MGAFCIIFFLFQVLTAIQFDDEFASWCTHVILEIGCVLYHIFLFQVLTAIQFDDEFASWCAKIHDVIANCVLAAKANVVQLMISQM